MGCECQYENVLLISYSFSRTDTSGLPTGSLAEGLVGFFGGVGSLGVGMTISLENKGLKGTPKTLPSSFAVFVFLLVFFLFLFILVVFVLVFFVFLVLIQEAALGLSNLVGQFGWMVGLK